MSQDCLTYFINTDYTIVVLDEEWDSLARDNHALHLIAENVMGRRLLDFISDDRTRFLFQRMFEKVLATDDKICLSYRCDTPDKRRLLELEVYYVDKELIGLRNKIISIEPREPVKLLDPATEKTDQFVAICSWCKKMRLPSEQWLEIEEAVEKMALFRQPVPPHLTHTICQSCFQKQLDEILG